MPRDRRIHPKTLVMSELGFERTEAAETTWLDGTGHTPDFSYEARTLAYCPDGAAQGDTDIFAMINAYWEDLDSTIQEGTASDWRRVVDTSCTSPLDSAQQARNES